MTPRSQVCDDLLKTLPDYLDGEATEAICRAIEEHMSGCVDCTAMINTLRKTIDLYHRQSSDPSLPPDVRLRLFQRLRLEDLADVDRSNR